MRLILAFVCAVLAAGAATAEAPAVTGDEKGVRDLLARFYDGWNAHDVEKMVSAYAEDVDHINVYAQWNQGKPAIRAALAKAHGGRLKDDHKTYTVEKIRFVKPDVAVAQVRSISHVGNIGTYVMTAENGIWQVVSFTNVEYQLPSGAPPR